MESVSSRHDGNLNGRIRDGQGAIPLAVSIQIPQSAAHLASVQHTAWMLINMLLRLENVVSEISVDCPLSVSVEGRRIVPFAQESVDLRDALCKGAEGIGIKSVQFNFEAKRHDLHLVLGPGTPGVASMQVFGEGWCGGISRLPEIKDTPRSNLPFGPYLAAAIAVGEVFKAVRFKPDEFQSPFAMFYSAWSQSASLIFNTEGPGELPKIELTNVLIGVGAVGSAFLHTLWSTPGLCGQMPLIDNDSLGIDLTNLNRYLLFGVHDLGKQKATTAGLLLAKSGISWLPYDGPIESFVGEVSRAVCAVDTNPSRLAVQVRWPETLIMGSTSDLRAEVVRCDPRIGGPCAVCYNRDPVEIADETLRTRFRKATQEEQRAIAKSMGADYDEAVDWSVNGTCGTSGERVKDALRESSDGHTMFAVPYVSGAAGVLLAAEVVKEELIRSTPLNPEIQRASIQFFRPDLSSGARRYMRDPQCIVCASSNVAQNLWLTRCEVAQQRRLAVSMADIPIE